MQTWLCLNILLWKLLQEGEATRLLQNCCMSLYITQLPESRLDCKYNSLSAKSTRCRHWQPGAWAQLQAGKLPTCQIAVPSFVLTRPHCFLTTHCSSSISNLPEQGQQVCHQGSSQQLSHAILNVPRKATQRAGLGPQLHPTATGKTMAPVAFHWLRAKPQS